MAGQLIMQGFVDFQIPLWVRRTVTMLPPFAVVALGVNSTNALVISQVVLSIALPLPMIALIIFTGRRDIMGGFANDKITRAAALIGAAVVLVLNMVLILQALGLQIPSLPAAG
jgi:manganese transport protein